MEKGKPPKERKKGLGMFERKLKIYRRMKKKVIRRRKIFSQ